MVMLPGMEIFLLFIGSLLLHFTNAGPTKHMYALCPPDFFGIGTECYFISQKKQNWLDAHFDCKDRKSRLAEPNRYEDRMIRRFLVNNDLSKESKWIGGNYNWAQKKWQWQDGKAFVYQSFSQTPGGVQELQYHCAILNPDLRYRWSASSCVEKHQYICQHRMPYVNEKHRARIYTRWNQTYPNEEATQVEVVLNDAELLKRGHRQSIPVNGRSTNTQRLNRHRNYLASEWLKKYRSQQIVLNRNAITNEVSLVNTQPIRNPQKPNRVAPRRRNPSIGRDDFIQFERNKNVNRGPLITNRVDDFDRPEPITEAPASGNRYAEQTTTPTPTTLARRPNRYRDDTSPPRRRKVESQLDEKEKKRLEDTKRLLETGRFENSYTRRRIATTAGTTTTTTTTTEPTAVDTADNEQRRYFERNRVLDSREQQEEEDQERLRDEEIRRNEERRREEELRRREEQRRRMEQHRFEEEQRQQEERRLEEERLQNQINDETLRLEQEEEQRRARIAEEEERRAEERKRIQDQHLHEKEEKQRLRELELKEREEEEQRLRDDEARRQEENRQRLEEIERQQQEAEEKKRQEEEKQRIDEEERRRKKEELKNKQRQRQNQVEDSEEDAVVNDLRLKEKLRREKIAKMKERISKLSPEDQLKFYELRGKRNKKNSNTENDTSTN